MKTIRGCFLVAAGALLAACLSTDAASPPATFRAGAFAMDVTPTNFPVIVNGGFLAKTADKVHDRLHARWLVFDDGKTRIALGVLDTCVIPREFADEVKARATKLTGIPVDRIMLSATHTHSAPSLMQCLGTPPDPNYPAFAAPLIVEGLKRAVDNLAPARVGWAVAQAPKHTNTRVWIRRPDKMLTDPFGDVTVRAMMHPGYQNPDAIGPVGPSDPAMTLLAVQSPDGRPIAVMANYSMHYFGAQAVSPDYYGLFAEKIGPLIGAGNGFVGIMSQGTSGDQHWMDYSQPKRAVAIDTYAAELAQIAADAYKSIVFEDWVPLAMREKTLRIATRQPDAKRLAWAHDLVAKMGDRQPKSQPEVYAREALWLKKNPTRAVKLQAVRVGELGIAIWPCEVFAISGLKIKAQSPLQPAMNIELANSEEGYIPPPEIYPLGGYNTWPCRSAGLAPSAEPTIVEALLSLLEDVSGKSRRKAPASLGAYAEIVLASKPFAYWRLDEWSGPIARDATGAGRSATYEPGVARWLDGPKFAGEITINRCAHFAGHRLNATLKGLGDTYTIELWFWDGMPGTGRLLELDGQPVSLKSPSPKTWQHLVLIRDGDRVTTYLDGNLAPDVIAGALPAAPKSITLAAGFEGKLDEVAIYDHALAATDIAAHWRVSGIEGARAAVERVQPPPFTGDYAGAVRALKARVYLPAVAADAGARSEQVGEQYSVAFWFRNILPNDARPVTAYLFSRGPADDHTAPGDHLGIGGTHGKRMGRLFFFNGNQRGQTLASAVTIPVGGWNHVVFVRAGKRVTAYLNGASAPAFDGEADVTTSGAAPFFIGARCDQFAPLDGQIAEFALFDRALGDADAATLYRAGGLPTHLAKGAAH
ncbi:MAG: LamG-like jellyroll fold domain-containing protein [Verrucomicrobiia bacterium]|jgi:hypothetical protein